MDIYYKNITVNGFNQVTSGTGYHPDSTIKLTFTNEFDSIYYVGGNSKDSVGKITYSNKVKLNDKKDAAELDETTVTKNSTKNSTPQIPMMYQLVSSSNVGGKASAWNRANSPSAPTAA